MKRTRPHSPYALEAAQLLGSRIAAGRRERRWTAQELAERAGITPFTLRKVERGDPTVAIGVVFEVATLVGVALFHEEPAALTADLRRARDRVALLPARVRRREEAIDDDF